MNKFIYTTTILFSIFCINTLSATTFTSVASGDWGEPATWDNDGVGDGHPIAGDIAVIQGGHAVVVDSNHAALEVNVIISTSGQSTSLTINTNTKLVITDSLSIQFHGNTSDDDVRVNNNGTLNIGKDLLMQSTQSTAEGFGPKLNSTDTINIDGDVLVSDASSNAFTKFAHTSADAVTYLAGSISEGANGGRFFADFDGSKLVMDGGGAQNLYTNGTRMRYDDLIITGTSTVVSLVADITATSVMDGVITIETGAELNSNNFDFTTVVFEGLTINDGGRYEVASTSVFPTSDFTTITNNGEVEFSASGATVAAAAYHDLTLSGGGTATITSGASASGVVTLSNSTTMACGTLGFTFVSSATRSAHLADVPGTSNITGTAYVQRYIPTLTSAQWQYLGSPMETGQSISAALHDDFTTSGFTNAEYDPTNTASFVSVKSYNPTGSAWADATDANVQTWDNDATFAVYAGNQDDDRAMDFEGTPVHNDVTVNCVNAGNNYNLIGNPHPAYISLNSLITSGFTNLGTSVYILNNSGAYKTIDGDDGKFLAPGEGMFVLATGASPSAAFLETYKSDPDSPTYRESKTSVEKAAEFNLQLTVKGYYYGGDYKDPELEITKLDNATEGYDIGMDADKLHHADAYPGLVAVATDNSSLIKNRIPNNEESITIPLRVEYPAINGYENIIKIYNVEGMLSKGNCLTFEDVNNGISFPITKDTTYSFMSPPGTVGAVDDGNGGWLPKDTLAGMFIHLASGASTESLSATCSYENNGHAVAIPNFDTPYDVQWSNGAGDIIKSSAGIIGADTLADVSGGHYFAQITGSGCGTEMNLNIFVDNPAAIVASFDGNNLASQVEKGNQIDFNNSSINGYAYTWDFGDGNGSNEISPSHIYDEFGTYDIMLIAHDGNCSDTATYKVEVVESVDTSVETAIDDHLSLVNYQNRAVLTGSIGHRIQEISIVNSLGQLVKVPMAFNGQKIVIDHPSEAGIYYVVVNGNQAGRKLKFIVQ